MPQDNENFLACDGRVFRHAEGRSVTLSPTCRGRKRLMEASEITVPILLTTLARMRRSTHRWVVELEGDVRKCINQ